MPRCTFTTEGALGPDNQTPLFVQLLYTTRSSPIPLASGVEAGFIVREAAGEPLAHTGGDLRRSGQPRVLQRRAVGSRDIAARDDPRVVELVQRAAAHLGERRVEDRVDLGERRADRHLEKGRIVIFAAGTGNPYFSTDTTAALRAAEIEAEVILMAKNKVDGVYNADPSVDANAKKYHSITYLDLLKEGLAVMDSTASSLCMDNNIPLIVFSIMEEGNIKRAVLGEEIGTVVRGNS